MGCVHIQGTWAVPCWNLGVLWNEAGCLSAFYIAGWGFCSLGPTHVFVVPLLFDLPCGIGLSPLVGW